MKKTKEEILENRIIQLRELRKKDEENYNELKKEITKMKKEILRQLGILEYNINTIMYVGDKRWNKSRKGEKRNG